MRIEDVLLKDPAGCLTHRRAVSDQSSLFFLALFFFLSDFFFFPGRQALLRGNQGEVEGNSSSQSPPAAFRRVRGTGETRRAWRKVVGGPGSRLVGTEGNVAGHSGRNVC